MPDSAVDDRFARYQALRCVLEDPFVELDLGCARLAEADIVAREAGLQRALVAMQQLEAGGIANPDEGRMVGHFWLRAPGLAPAESTLLVTEPVFNFGPVQGAWVAAGGWWLVAGVGLG